MNTLLVNLFGGPGVGKSTLAAGLFHALKIKGVETELVTEFAKDLVWDGSLEVMRDQLYIFATQRHRLWRLLGKVQVVITDSPMLLSLYYAPFKSAEFNALVVDQHYTLCRRLDVLVPRTKPYSTVGRVHREDEARRIDDWCMATLAECYGEGPVVSDNIDYITEVICSMID